tara:strand:+ start:540 stop:1124 length:585 start_codon:yes stop_codon:yes gene_type:complete
VIKPVYYKSFRSRKAQKFEQPSTSIIEVLNNSDNNILDIGFGTGESTLYLKDNFPELVVCGIEAYKIGISNLFNKDIYLHYGDALEIIEQIRSNSITQIYMLFPDPWQKKKHRKRRLFNHYTFKIIDSILKKNGLFHFSSDNINYAFEARQIIRDISKNEINFSNNRGQRPVTKYERKAILKKNFIFDLVYIKN